MSSTSTVPEAAFDPGFTRRVDGDIRRLVNRDGTFNVRRRGMRLRDFHLFQFFVALSWPRFLSVIFAGYLAVNVAFALVYLGLGIENLHGADRSTAAASFLSAFFFSSHTFTTTGYGSISPSGLWTNAVASVEALTGLLALAIATGLLYGRFSQASARLAFSERMLVAPHGGGTALMFRIANRRSTTLMDLGARLLLVTVVEEGGRPVRRYRRLELETPSVYFMPLSWTLVHPITEASPLWGMGPEALAGTRAEVLVLVQGYDDTFRQTIYGRWSFRHDEIRWGAKFRPAFHPSEHGDMLLDLNRMDDVEVAPLDV
jgi:inward rectifier potassium channel